MPSNAHAAHLLPLLRDAEELVDTRRHLRDTSGASPPRIAALNRAVVVSCVSAWEAYVEALVAESLDRLRPPAVTDGLWSVLTAPAADARNRFHTPNEEQVQRLIRDTIGLPDIRGAWGWRRADARWVRGRLKEVITPRHQIAHGINPRPVVPTSYVGTLPDFFRRLGR